MKLFAIIANAQAGQLFDALGKNFGVDGETAAGATRYFVPAMRKAVELKSETLPGLIAVLDFLGARQARPHHCRSAHGRASPRRRGG